MGGGGEIRRGVHGQGVGEKRGGGHMDRVWVREGGVDAWTWGGVRAEGWAHGQVGVVRAGGWAHGQVGVR